MKFKRNFLSDNSSGVHPKILSAIADANTGHAEAYGADPFTHDFEKQMAALFGPKSRSFPVYSGTGANVIALAHLTRSYESILCSEMAHINVSETGAPEKFSGCKLVGIPSCGGKITPEDLKPYLSVRGSMHASQPRIISISQSTEVGTVYTCAEIRALADFAHAEKMKLHVDGARLANAAVALNCSFQEMILETGVDILSFGATKNGLLFGDAVTFLNASDSEGFLYQRKHGLQLASKMRFISAQLLAYLKDDLWKEMATQSNERAKQLADGLLAIDQVKIAHPVQTNVVFAEFPETMLGRLREAHPFHVWKAPSLARLMTSFDTSSEDIEAFLTTARNLQE